MWQYEESPNVWVNVDPRSDRELNELYLEFKQGKDVRGRVFHCFGDKMSVGVDFNKMKTHCLSSHKPTGLVCPVNNHNVFNIRHNSDM